MTSKIQDKVLKLKKELMNIMNNSELGTFCSDENCIYSDAINFICDFCSDAEKQGEVYGLILDLNKWEALAEVEKIIDQRGEDVQIQFNADENITLRDSIRRVFGIDTDIVTYEMYKKCLELREQLAEEDRQALKEQ